MKQIAGRILIVVVGLALVSWILGYLAYGGGQSSEEAKTQFVTELRQFDAFEAHQALLLDTVEREPAQAKRALQLDVGRLPRPDVPRAGRGAARGRSRRCRGSTGPVSRAHRVTAHGVL